jgi:hypothetical protein
VVETCSAMFQIVALTVKLYNYTHATGCKLQVLELKYIATMCIKQQDRLLSLDLIKYASNEQNVAVSQVDVWYKARKVFGLRSLGMLVLIPLEARMYVRVFTVLLFCVRSGFTTG